MAETSEDPKRQTAPEEQAERQQSTRPENWPGIPGRSREHEGKPDSPTRQADAEVTQSQRELERDGPLALPQRWANTQE